MRKILWKKLQLRSTTIATLTGPGLRIVKGGTNDVGVDDDGGDIGGNGSGVPICEPAGNASRDHNTGPVNCHVPISEHG